MDAEAKIPAVLQYPFHVREKDNDQVMQYYMNDPSSEFTRALGLGLDFAPRFGRGVRANGVYKLPYLAKQFEFEPIVGGMNASFIDQATFLPSVSTLVVGSSVSIQKIGMHYRQLVGSSRQ